MPPEPTQVHHDHMLCTGTSEYMGTEATWQYMDPGNTLRLVLTADPDGREPVVACAVECKVVGNQRKLSRGSAGGRGTQGALQAAHQIRGSSGADDTVTTAAAMNNDQSQKGGSFR